MNQFFGRFNIPQQDMEYINLTPQLKYNITVMEITNNWLSVNNLIEKLTENETITVDILEKKWLNFITENKINIKSYENKLDFMNKNLKELWK